MDDSDFSQETIKPDFMPGETERAMYRHRLATRGEEAALVHPGARVSGMSDNELRDIGLRPRSLTSTVYREIGKPGLVDFGWRLGR